MENKYYVYEHVRLDTNEVFYVGKGCYNRAYEKTNRSPEWHSTATYAPYIVKIVQDKMLEMDAYALENQLIFEYGLMIEGGVLVNKRFNHFKYEETIRTHCAVTYRFTGELIDKIDAKAEELNISKNTLVAQILTKALKNVKMKGDKNV